LSIKLKTTNDVIISALYLIGELGVDETPDAFMLSTGLELINELLSKFSASGIYIPFVRDMSGTFTAGKSVYSISNTLPADIINNPIVDLIFVNFSLPSGMPSITYPIKVVDQSDFYDISRQSTFSSLPAIVFLTKQGQQSLLNFYPAPSDAYAFNLRAKVTLDALDQQESLGELPPWMYGFLKYAVARKFLSYYPSANWPQQNEEEYQDYYAILKSSSGIDLSIESSGLLIGPTGFAWQNILAYP
jgi:hypothetical protein